MQRSDLQHLFAFAGALFLGLVPIALRTVFHLDSPLLGGAGAAVAFGSAAITAFATGRFGAHRVVLIGAGAVVLGAILGFSLWSSSLSKRETVLVAAHDIDRDHRA